MPEDNRLYFIRNAELLKTPKKEPVSFEYEVITDAPVLGECEYTPIVVPLEGN